MGPRASLSVVIAVALLGAAPTSLGQPANRDFRISDVGGVGESGAARAAWPAVVYNGEANEYFVAWHADDTDTAGIVNDEDEIFAQRLDPDGDPLTEPIRVSDAGGTGSATSDAFTPAIAYNSQANEYLVTWKADDTDTPGIVDEEFEIFGQRLTATGAQTGANDFRISDAGGTGTTPVAAEDPAITYNSQANEYLVTWEADDTDTAGIANDEFEIFAQRVSAAGADTGMNDFRVSDAGGTGNGTRQALNPAVTYNTQANEYLVTWKADDTDAGLVDNETEIFAQRLDGDDGTETGANDLRVSDAGGTGSAGVVSDDPAVAYNRQANEYLVTWEANDTDAGLAANEFEIFGQRLSDSGAQMAANDFRVSDAGGTGNGTAQAANPAVAYNTQANEYLISWRADDTDAGLVDNETEIFAQRLAASGNETGANDFRVSDAGGSGATAAAVERPVPAYNTATNQYLVIWYADDTDAGLLDDEFEIFGRRLAPPVNVDAPEVTGVAAEGGQLNCSQGSWQNAPSGFAFQWRRGGIDIDGATAATYTVTTADIGETLTCRVTASNDAGSISAGSASVVPPENPGPAGPTGPQGPAGPQEPATKLLMAIVADGRLRARFGKRVRVPYVSTAAGDALLVVRRRGKRVGRRRSTAEEGDNRIRWNAKINGQPAPAGRYKLLLTVIGDDAQVATDSVKLRIRKKKT
jgi:hypothetical protein